jgi:polyphosphate kinase
MEIEHASVFRVSRNSEYEIDDEEVEDLLKAIEEEVRKRRRGFAVRLEIEPNAHPVISNYLMQALDIEASDVYAVDDLIDLTGLFQVYNLPGFPQLRDPQFVSQQVTEFVTAPNIFAAIRARDILVHHPYEAFGHVVDFIESAAKDERVLAIKQTLYRTNSDSSIVKALQFAADNGKQLTAVIELKARLDEERNIQWARELEKSGVHVVFGFIGLKTHCKVALVVAAKTTASAAMSTWPPATTTRSPAGSIPTSDSSPATTTSATTPRPCSITSPATPSCRNGASSWWPRAACRHS